MLTEATIFRGKTMFQNKQKISEKNKLILYFFKSLA